MRRIMIVGLIAGLCLTPWADGQARKRTGWRKVGDKAPALSVYFMKGDPVTLKEGLGKNVFIIEFWATWCGPCKVSIPHLTELQKKYADDGLVVIGISEEASGLVRPFIEEMGDTMDYRVAIDKGSSTRISYTDGYGADQGLPKAYVIDVNGRLVWFGNPLNSFLDEIVQTLLADVPKDRPKAVPEVSSETTSAGSSEAKASATKDSD